MTHEHNPVIEAMSHPENPLILEAIAVMQRYHSKFQRIQHTKRSRKDVLMSHRYGAAWEKIATQHEGMVRASVRAYRSAVSPWQLLYNAGLTGLTEAALTFKKAANTKLSTHAYWLIDKQVKLAAMNSYEVVPSHHVFEDFRKLQAILSSRPVIWQDLSDQDITYIAHMAQMSEAQVRNVQLFVLDNNSISLEAPAYLGEEGMMSEVIADPFELEDEDILRWQAYQLFLERARQILDEKQFEVITLLAHDESNGTAMGSQKLIADQMGMNARGKPFSSSSVWGYKNKAIAVLKSDPIARTYAMMFFENS